MGACWAINNVMFGRFHVANLSSAHVYLRLPEGKTMDDIPADTLIDCAQLVKANSIQGNKENNVEVVYTPWGNLKKTAAMEVGQVRGLINSLADTTHAHACPPTQTKANAYVLMLARRMHAQTQSGNTARGVERGR
jgi:hypothetical protein